MADERIQLIISAVDRATGPLKGIVGSFTELNQSLELARKAYGLVAGAIGALIDAASEEEQQWIKVSSALRSKNRFSEENLRLIKATVDALEMESGMADERLAGAYQRLTTAGYGLAESTRFIRLALDIAATGIGDFESSLDAFVRGGADMERQLRMLASKFDIVTTEGASVAEVMEKINDQVSGRRTDAMKGYAGQVRELAIEWERFKEDVGKPLLWLFTGLARQLLVTFRDPAGIKEYGAAYVKAAEDVSRLVQTSVDAQKQFAQAASGMSIATDKMFQGGRTVSQYEQTTASVQEFDAAMQHFWNFMAKDRAGTLAEQLREQANAFGDFMAFVKQGVVEVPSMFELSQEAVRAYADEFNRALALFNKYRDAAEKNRIATERLAESIRSSMGEAMGTAAQALFGLADDADAVWRRMADAFYELFIAVILAELGPGGTFIGAFLRAFKFWDVAENDRALIAEGRKAVSLLQEGMAQAAAQMPVPAFAMGGGGSGMGSVNINFYGPVTDRAFIRRTVLPEIQRGIAGRRTRIALNDNNLTGKANVSLI